MLNDFQVEIDLLADGANFIREQLQEMGYSVSGTETLEKLGVKYFNVLKRLIPLLPRQILISKSFSCPPGYEKGLEIISNKIRNGEDLRPHLSKRIKNLDYKDILLNDWGIHHLHLGTTLDSPDFITRTGLVLFVRFDKNKAFFIDIMEHGNNVAEPWSQQHLIRILHNSWPDSIKTFTSSRIKRLSHVPSDTDIKDFRKAGIQTSVQLEEGVVYFPLGGGYNSLGESIDARIQSNIWIRSLKNWEKYVRDNYLLLVEQAKTDNIVFNSKLKFSLMIDPLQVNVLEEGSQVAWKLCDSWFPMPWLSGY